ncbi:MAG: hypothetical protein IJY46_08745 [Lentisphaeria bacterium]|nr:hypothetical protein [Lentisphaeria bacterium]
MKKNTIIFLFIAIAAVFISGCCCKDKEQEFMIIEFASSKDSNYIFNGRQYLVLLYKQGENYFLQSHIPNYTERIVFSHYLGKNVFISSDGLQFKDGQMTVKYRGRNEDWHKVGVPFGDFIGDKHVSQMKFKYSPNEPYSEKYGIAGVLKREEPAVEAFLPTLQKHLRNNDADAISKMIIYPIEAGDVWFKNRHEFLKYYPRIFTEEIKKELLKLQNKDVLCNFKGLMLSHGIGMWFFPYDDKAYFQVLNLSIY